MKMHNEETNVQELKLQETEKLLKNLIRLEEPKVEEPKLKNQG